MSIKNWILATRPKTLGTAIAPVFIGSALAQANGYFSMTLFVCILASTLLIQIGTNLANDYFDFKNGKDTPERLGPTRVTASGLIKPETVKKATILSFGIALLFGIILMIHGGLPIILIGILSILAGVAYTGGPYPLGYNGLGDITAFIFFGPIAVAGTYYLYSFEWSKEALILGIGTGLLAAALLAINNIRDIKEDTKTGKKTLAVRFGKKAILGEYCCCLSGASLLPSIVLSTPIPSIACLIFSFVLIIKAIKTEEKAYNQILAQTGMFIIIYSLLISINLLL